MLMHQTNRGVTEWRSIRRASYRQFATIWHQEKPRRAHDAEHI
jgi:hypothetical protein